MANEGSQLFVFSYSGEHLFAYIEPVDKLGQQPL